MRLEAIHNKESHDGVQIRNQTFLFFDKEGAFDFSSGGVIKNIRGAAMCDCICSRFLFKGGIEKVLVCEIVGY